MEIHQIPILRSPVMFVAFSGWSDAADAATGALQHLMNAWKDETPESVPQLIADVDPEEFYDFQVNRPQVHNDGDGGRHILWPNTQVYGVLLPQLDFDLVVVSGIEPSMRWKSFVHDLLDIADDLEVTTIISLGSLLADVPHTRPLKVNITGANSEISARLDLQTPMYEGPTGIIGAINDGANLRGMDALSLWVPVPHYASNSPSPKASLALLDAIEDFLHIDIPQAQIMAEADKWENEVNDLASQDSDVADYIKALEETKDAAEIPEVSGDAIAKEFERYLRRHNKD